MVTASNIYSYRHANGSSADSEKIEEEFEVVSSGRFPDVPCRLVVVSKHEFGEKLSTVEESPRSVGVTLESWDYRSQRTP